MKALPAFIVILSLMFCLYSFPTQAGGIFTKKEEINVEKSIFETFRMGCFLPSEDIKSWADKSFESAFDTNSGNENYATRFGYPDNHITKRVWSQDYFDFSIHMAVTDNDGCLVISNHISKPKKIEKYLLELAMDIETSTGYTTYLEQESEFIKNFTPWWIYLLSIDNPVLKKDTYIVALLKTDEGRDGANTKFFFIETEKYIKTEQFRPRYIAP
jgi:hypothetical protein